ncbi:hypothetical protein EDD11_005263 [Mortierella claussenii]|nr:hypothetical protein EDD11_005263 [Mortierella claussenii]
MTGANTRGSTIGAYSAVARPIMPRSRPSMTQFHVRDQPARMIIPPPYGQEKVQEAAKALAAGIPDGIPRSGSIHVPAAAAAAVLSDSESSISDEDPEVRVHFEIHLQEDAESEPICPLSEKHVNTLAQELGLTPQERAEVEAIQTKEELATYFEKIPRDYDVQIIISDNTPDSPGVTFAQDEQVLNGDSIAVVRRESISSSFREKKGRRRKQKYRRPTTDLSTMPVEEPKASWLELFYDLLFVANLTEFTHSHPITGSTALGHYICWFVIMWWSWAGQTFWAARYDMDDLFTKVWKLVEFCALISFGAFSSDHLNTTATGFISSYIVLKAVLVIEYSNEVAVLVSFGRRTSVTFAGSHLPERFALFTIIVLGEIFHKTTTLSQLWAYLHLPFHVCIVLVGTGALDLIRLYKLEHHIQDIVAAPAHMVSNLSSTSCSNGMTSYMPNMVPFVALGFEVPETRKSTSGVSGAGSLAERATDYDLTKQYFLIVCSLVFLCNSLLKWINLRSYDKFQRIVYLSRLLNAICILCLLAVPLDKMTPFALLGSMAFFCVLQVAVDLAVIYFGAYGFVDDLEAWARSARSSIDLGSFLPSPLGGRSRGHSRANSRPGSVVNLNALSLDGINGAKRQHYQYHYNNSTASLANPTGVPFPPASSPTAGSYFPPQKLYQQQQQLSLQRQTSTLSQQQQQALYNMHINANSLGVSGAYGNLVQALAEIKKREQWNHPVGSGDSTSPTRQMSLSATGRSSGFGYNHGHGTHLVPRSSDGGNNLLIQRNSISLKRPDTEQSRPISPALGTSSGGDRSGLTTRSISGSPSVGAAGLRDLFSQPSSGLTTSLLTTTPTEP